jgi:hypothetical protein
MLTAAVINGANRLKVTLGVFESREQAAVARLQVDEPARAVSDTEKSVRGHLIHEARLG